MDDVIQHWIRLCSELRGSELEVRRVQQRLHDACEEVTRTLSLLAAASDVPYAGMEYPERLLAARVESHAAIFHAVTMALDARLTAQRVSIALNDVSLMKGPI